MFCFSLFWCFSVNYGLGSFESENWELVMCTHKKINDGRSCDCSFLVCAMMCVYVVCGGVTVFVYETKLKIVVLDFFVSYLFTKKFAFVAFAPKYYGLLVCLDERNRRSKKIMIFAQIFLEIFKKKSEKQLFLTFAWICYKLFG